MTATNTSRQCFHTRTNIGHPTRTMPCVPCTARCDGIQSFHSNAICLLSPLHRNRLPNWCQTKGIILSCLLVSSRAVMLVWVTLVRCETDHHSHPKWLTSSCAYRCDSGRRFRSTLANKYSIAWWFHVSCSCPVLKKKPFFVVIK